MSILGVCVGCKNLLPLGLGGVRGWNAGEKGGLLGAVFCQVPPAEACVGCLWGRRVILGIVGNALMVDCYFFVLTAEALDID